MKKIIAFIFALVAAYSLHAAYVKIDFDARQEGIKLKSVPGLKNIRKIHPPWAGKQKDFYLCQETTGNLSKSWKTYTVVF